MKRTIVFLTLLALSLSACGAIQPERAPTALPAAMAPVIHLDTPTSSPFPTATFITVPTSTPTQYVPPPPAADCNLADLVAQGLQKEETQPGADASAYTLILRLTNSGSCTWTTGYSLILAHNNGMDIQARQYFSTHAIPGQTVELPISLSVPDEDGWYQAIWLLEDPNGDIFGLSPSRDQLVNMEVLVAGDETVFTVNEWLFPSEHCSSHVREFTLPSFARLMHDPQWMPWPSRMQDPDWNPQFHYDWYPETVQLWKNPAGGDGRLPYSREWLEYLRAIQPNDEAAVWIARVAAGLFNKGNDFIPILDLRKLDDPPVAESISSGGNVVRLMEFRNGAARIQMIYFKDPIPSSRAVNYFTTPWLVTKFTSVSIDGELGNAGGIDVYFPNLAKQPEGYWVDMDRIEYFPLLPKCVTVEFDLSVYAEADDESERLGYLAPDQEILILEYLPQGSDVWGRINDGWVLLVFQNKGIPVYPTTWEMETRPPIYFD